MNNFSKVDSSSSPSRNVSVVPKSAGQFMASVAANDKKDQKSEIEEDVIEEDENYSDEFN